MFLLYNIDIFIFNRVKISDFRTVVTNPLGKHRRNRTAFSQQQLAALEQTFAKTQYPDLENRENLARKTGLPEPKIQVCISFLYIILIDYSTDLS